MSNKPKMLYVDDEPVNLMLFAVNFKKRFNVITAESGFSGLAMLKSHSDIRVVVSDMKMPGMTGTDFIRVAKNDFPHITYFILTGFEITQEISDALKEGLIQKYFRKPFNVKEMEACIDNVLT